MHTTRTAVALGALLILTATACGSDEKSSGSATNNVAVSLTDSGCSPATLTAPAGSITFAVDNATKDQAEFEIISAKPEILTEKFVDAGAKASYPVTLVAGDYEILCGRPSNTRAKLTVGGGGTAAAGATTTTVVDPAKLEAATAAYRTYVAQQVALLQSGTKQFTDAVRSGDTDAAKALYGAVRRPWERIEPVAELFPDSDAVIDSRSDDFPKAEADPDFTGFHAIEYGLWSQGTIDGATVDLNALADRLDTDITDLVTKIGTITIEPQIMTNGAAALIEEAAQTKITGEEDRYSHADLDTFAANVEGSQEVFTLVEPLLRTTNPQLADDLTGSFTRIAALLKQYASGDGYASYETVTQADRDKFKTELAQLSEELSQVTGSLGLTVKS